MKYLPVAGTHGWSGRLSGEWWQEGSPWVSYMDSQGFELYTPEDPFVWDTGIGGLPWLGTSGWYAAGLALRHYDGFGEDPVRIVAHSHGAQVVAFAAARGLKIRSLVTVGSPVREDMRRVWEFARPNIGYWAHCYSDWSDRTQLLGSLFDGAFGIQRRFEWEGALGAVVGADRHISLPGLGHSGILTKEKHFDVWTREGILSALAR